MVGYPLIHEELRLGALNVYSESRRWSNDDLDVLGVFADLATAYLVRTVQLAEGKKLLHDTGTRIVLVPSPQVRRVLELVFPDPSLCSSGRFRR